jgi:hypothetical protein
MEKSVDPRSNVLNTESYLTLVSLCLCAEFFNKPFHSLSLSVSPPPVAGSNVLKSKMILYCFDM